MGLLSALFTGIGHAKSKEKAEWGVATSSDGGFPMIIRYRMAPPSGISTTDFKKLIAISWKYIFQNEKRMPGISDIDRMNVLEDLLESGIESKGIAYLTVIVTCNGAREYQWYTKDSDFFMKALNGVLAGQKPFPIEIVIQDDPGWNAYKRFAGNFKK